MKILSSKGDTATAVLYQKKEGEKMSTREQGVTVLVY